MEGDGDAAAGQKPPFAPNSTGSGAPDGPPTTATNPSGETSVALDPTGLGLELAQWRERALRARADYDNLQKRTARDADAERIRQKAKVVEGFLPLLELAHMASHQATTHPGPLTEGVVLLAREFDRFAEREGLQKVGQVGDVVDATQMEVLAQEAADGVDSGKVSRVVSTGWMLDGRVLRFAKVCVQPT